MVKRLKEDIEIISPRHRETEIDYVYFYPRVGSNGDGGFAFPCDKDGNIDFDNMRPEMIDSYEWCESHPEKFDEPYVRQDKHSYMQNAIAKCECGKKIELYDEYMGACECPYCHRWYNMFGQELKNPNTWKNGEDW